MYVNDILIIFGDHDIHKSQSQNLGPWLMKSSQSNFNLRSPGSYLARSYLIATVAKNNTVLGFSNPTPLNELNS